MYKILGIPLASLKGRSVIEFAPPRGGNATAVLKFKPSSSVFVDASQESLKELHRKKDKGIFGDKKIEIIDKNIFDYSDKRKFARDG